MSKERPNDERKVDDIIADKEKIKKEPRRKEFARFLKNAADVGYLERINKELNVSRLELCKQLDQEITRNMEAVRMIESLKMAIQIHSGDICSANNESDQFIGKNQDLEEANQCLVNMLSISFFVLLSISLS